MMAFVPGLMKIFNTETDRYLAMKMSILWHSPLTLKIDH